MTRPMLWGSRAAGARQMGSAHQGTGRSRGAPQVEMDPAVQEVVHVGSSSLTLAGRNNSGVIARHSRRRGAGQQAVHWADDLYQT
jgi:hypothetical protein